MTDAGPVRKGGYRIAPGAGERGRARSGEDDEIVPVDDLVGQPVGQLGGLAAGHRSSTAEA